MTYLLAYLSIMALALALAKVGVTGAYLVAYAMLEPIKRVLSPFIYPVAWLFRSRLRARDKDRPRLWAKLWEPYLFKPTFRPLWWFLDDSLCYSQGKEYDDKEKRYPGWLWKLAGGEDPLPSEDNPCPESFLKAWWWAAVRNSCVNWNNSVAYKVGAYVETLRRYGSARNFYEVRRYASGDVLPYCEFYIAGRWNQVGFLRGSETGSSRFEIDVMKRRA